MVRDLGRGAAVAVALAGVYVAWLAVVFVDDVQPRVRDPRRWTQWTVAGAAVTLPLAAAESLVVIWLIWSRRSRWWPRALAIPYALLLVPFAVLTANPDAAWFPWDAFPALLVTWPFYFVEL